MQCPDRTTNLTRGLFHHRQKASLEPPAQLVVFGLYNKRIPEDSGILSHLKFNLYLK
jgi:hypothetical protein